MPVTATSDRPARAMRESAPREPTMRELLRDAVRGAVRAPSSHNTQPWLFRLVGDDTLELYADRTRALPVVDPRDRELTISCGAALFHVRCALRAGGRAGEVALLPDPDDPDLLARVRPGAPHVPSTADRVLAAAIPRRHTNRLAYEDRALAPHVLALLLASAAAEGAWLVPVETPARRAVLAALTARADRTQDADPSFRRELASWMRPGDGARADGMPGWALGIPDVLSRLAPHVVAAADLGPALAARDRGRVERAPTMAVLATVGDAPRDWLVTGQALGRVLLTACAAGVAASFMNQPLEVPALRERVAALLQAADDPSAPGDTATPQLVLRFGYAPEGRPTPRRPVDDVLR